MYYKFIIQKMLFARNFLKYQKLIKLTDTKHKSTKLFKTE